MSLPDFFNQRNTREFAEESFTPEAATRFAEKFGLPESVVQEVLDEHKPLLEIATVFTHFPGIIELGLKNKKSSLSL